MTSVDRLAPEGAVGVVLVAGCEDPQALRTSTTVAVRSVQMRVRGVLAIQISLMDASMTPMWAGTQDSAQRQDRSKAKRHKVAVGVAVRYAPAW
jgi:hypothetical protein